MCQKPGFFSRVNLVRDTHDWKPCLLTVLKPITATPLPSEDVKEINPDSNNIYLSIAINMFLRKAFTWQGTDKLTYWFIPTYQTFTLAQTPKSANKMHNKHPSMFSLLCEVNPPGTTAIICFMLSVYHPNKLQHLPLSKILLTSYEKFGPFLMQVSPPQNRNPSKIKDF